MAPAEDGFHQQSGVLKAKVLEMYQVQRLCSIKKAARSSRKGRVRVCGGGGGAGARSVCGTGPPAPTLQHACALRRCPLPGSELWIRGLGWAGPIRPKSLGGAWGWEWGWGLGLQQACSIHIPVLSSRGRCCLFRVPSKGWPPVMSFSPHPTPRRKAWLGPRWHETGAGPPGRLGTSEPQLLAGRSGSGSQAPFLVHRGPAGVFQTG